MGYYPSPTISTGQSQFYILSFDQQNLVFLSTIVQRMGYRSLSDLWFCVQNHNINYLHLVVKCNILYSVM